MAITINGTTGITSPGLSVDSPTLVVDDANNRVGIGTDNPPAELTVDGFVVIGNPETTGSGGTLRIAESSNSIYIQPGSNLSNDSSCDLIVSSIYGATEKLRITSAGNVGIGTNNPSQKFVVYNGNIKLQGEPSNIANLIFTRTDRSWSINNETDFRIYTSSGTTDSPSLLTLTITGGGNVGIGTNNPVSFVGQTHHTVNYSGGSTQVSGYNLMVNGTRYASFISYPSNSEALRITSHSDSLPMIFQTNNQTRITIKADGNVGIGTTNPTYNVTAHNKTLGVYRDDSTEANIYATTNTRQAGIRFINDRAHWRVYAFEDHVKIRHIGTTQNPTTVNTAEFYTDKVIFNRNLQFASGRGIDFSATGNGPTVNSELLDDYEEGNFTAVLGYSNTTALSNVTIIRRSGTYVKVGSMVWFQLDIAASIAWGSIGTINNGLQIQGLPFTCEPVATYQTGSSYIAINCVPRHWTTPWPTSQSPSNDPPLWKVGHNETWLTSYTNRNNNSDYVYTVADWDAAASNSTKTFEIQLYGVYSTTS